MQGYVIRRVLALIPTLIFASFIVFITVRLIPGNIIDLMLSSERRQRRRSRRRAQLEAALGLDQPMLHRSISAGSARSCSMASLGKSLWQQHLGDGGDPASPAGDVRARR